MRRHAVHAHSVRGYVTLLVLVFGGVCSLLIVSLVGYLFAEKQAELAYENRVKSFHIAEAGLEYYRWRLAHWPNDLTDGTGMPGPYTRTLRDPEGGDIGTFTLSISGASACGKTLTARIAATGRSVRDARISRTISADYARPTVASYATITNSSVWVGADRVINGPYHSNGGIRMDGTHNADVVSAVSSWSCTPSFGCSPSVDRPGVFGAGGPSGLWRYPAPTVDFAGIQVDLAELKGYATTSGVYLPPSGSFGWKITLRADGRVDAARVTQATQVLGFSTELGWVQERSVVQSTGPVTTYTVPASCPVVFAEDTVWLEGVAGQKLVVAAADVSSASVDRSLILSGNITAIQSAGLTALAERDVLIGLSVPDVMTIQGIFIAQKGRFGRNHYCSAECDSSRSGSEAVPSSLASFVRRTSLTTLGTVVSNGRVGTKWTSGNTFLSGFSTRTDTYDRALQTAPPPFTPVISDDYVLTRWRDER
ncbi:hypothetical protein KGO06_02105 [Patescibacteria group bacterium]|nr:hypothetical protein [Patescibacteria group bacterium]